MSEYKVHLTVDASYQLWSELAAANLLGEESATFTLKPEMLEENDEEE